MKKNNKTNKKNLLILGGWFSFDVGSSMFNVGRSSFEFGSLIKVNAKKTGCLY